MRKLLISLIFLMATSVFAGPGLADGAAKFVGNITTNGQVRSDFTSLWNQITAENECKWASIQGNRGSYNWSGCDAAYNWAKNNGGHFKFHALVWGSQYPNWLNGLSADETKKAITEWFDAVKKHYPDLEMIDVVNEAIKSGGSYHSGYGKNNNIIPALGGDNGNYEFVATAFKMARERWPEAILIYNDYNTVQWQKNEGIDLINKLKKQNAPVDAYGLQAHDMQVSGGGNGGTGGGGSCLNINTLKSAIEEIWNKTQMPMFISEYDIASNDDQDQKNCYSQQISYFMENEHIAGITLWGYIYGSTWTSGGNSGIIRNGQDRPAMTWLKEYLKSNKGVNTTGLPTGDGATVVDPEPQTPFKGQPSAVPGKIEAEDFDNPGKGKGNNSYAVGSTGNGDSDYRDGTTVNVYKKATGNVIGYNQTGNYYQYTVTVPEDGTYTVVAHVAAEGAGAFQFKVDERAVSGEFAVEGTSWDDFFDVTGTVDLKKGTQFLTLEVTKEYFDIDYFEFKAVGDTVVEPPVASADPVLDTGRLHDYFVFGPTGAKLGVLSAYGFEMAMEILKVSDAVRSSGVYVLRERFTGETRGVRIVR